MVTQNAHCISLQQRIARIYQREAIACGCRSSTNVLPELGTDGLVPFKSSVLPAVTSLI